MGIYIPSYFSSIHQYSLMLKEENILFEVHDNYQKQSYRNRCYISGPNGKQLLSIPIKYDSSEGRIKSKDIKVENDFPWQNQHFKALRVAYRSSPFFELLEEEISPIFTKKYEYLYDVNIDTLHFILDTLGISIPIQETSSYSMDYQNDYREVAHKKFQPIEPNKQYTQMFDEKNGFIKNLSILDLLFMEGPNTISYL
ncbi:MAG: WbqC family protein [Polaribacter sp.]|jgi:hypothetical protein